ARNMSRYRETLADPAPGGEVEHLAVPRRQADELGQPRPGEADAGQLAGAVHRVAGPEPVAVEVVDPVVRVVGEADRRAVQAVQVDVVGDREIGEAHLMTDLAQQSREVAFGPGPGQV